MILRLLALVQSSDGDLDATDDDGEVEADPSLLRWIKSSAGDVSLKTMLDEVAKLEAIRAFDLPGNVLRDVAVKVVAEWKHAALIESPSHVRRRAEPVQAAMLVALLLDRQQQITDALVQLLISTVHRIGLRAEKKVFRQMAAEFTPGGQQGEPAAEGGRRRGAPPGRDGAAGGVPPRGLGESAETWRRSSRPAAR